MARYQDLPNRTDTITVPIDDATMCTNYGSTFTCTINSQATKTRLEVIGSCQCTFTVPSGVNTIFIELWSGGGGGGGTTNCQCCTMGQGGGGGNYISTTLAVTPGDTYSICAGAAGGMGACCRGAQGATSYVTGTGLTTFCAVGGMGGCGGCNLTSLCFGQNGANCSTINGLSSANIQNFAIAACGEGGHIFGCSNGCRSDGKGGNAAFAGGIGSFTTYSGCCPNGCCSAYGAAFPGGGGGGTATTCECSYCLCGSCGSPGLVRLWY